VSRASPLWSAVRFPIAFRSGLEGAPFQIASFFVLFYVVMPQLAEPASSLMKYLFVIAEVPCFALLAMTRPINLSPLFPLGLLLLFVMGCLSLFYSTFLEPGTTTYSSALIPLIITTMPLLIATGAARTNSEMATRYLVGIFTTAAFFHVFWQALANLLGWEELETYYGWLLAPLINGTIVLVFVLILSGLFRRNRLFFLSLALIGLDEVLRPTSTLAFGTLFAIAVIALHRLGLHRGLRRSCMLLVITILVTNLAILESEDFADAIYSIEPLIKQDTLDGSSNNEFRLGVLAAARYEMSQYSLLIGKAFTGDVAVNAHFYLPWVEGEDKTAIHSDFIIMIVQGGIIGYGLFASLFLGMASLCTRAAQLAHAARDRNSETLFDGLQAMNVAFMLYISPQPSMQVTQCVLPCLMLVPLTIFLARSQSGYSELKRTIGRENFD
jgi:hypothetical protein